MSSLKYGLPPTFLHNPEPMISIPTFKLQLTVPAVQHLIHPHSLICPHCCLSLGESPSICMAKPFVWSGWGPACTRCEWPCPGYRFLTNLRFTPLFRCSRSYTTNSNCIQSNYGSANPSLRELIRSRASVSPERSNKLTPLIPELLTNAAFMYRL